jgi:membrane-bound lytic murein transglycosylase
MDTLTHYTEQATLAGSAEHVAALIRNARYTAQDVATLISALATHAARLEAVGMAGFDKVSELMDKAADLAEDAYFEPEFAHAGVRA